MANDNILAGAAGGLQGINDLLGQYMNYQYQRKGKQQDLMDEMALYLQKLDAQRKGKQQDLMDEMALYPQKLDAQRQSDLLSRQGQADIDLRKEQTMLPLKEASDIRVANAKPVVPTYIMGPDGEITGNVNGKISRTPVIKQTPEQKKMEERKKLEVPGFNLSDDITPLPREADKIREAMGRLDNFEQGVNDMKALVDKHGSFEYFGESGAAMNSLATDLQLEAKELKNLGVLNGPDLGLIQKMIADPGSLKSMFTRDKSRQSELSTTLKQIKRNVATQLSSKGYSKTPTTGGASAPAVGGLFNGQKVLKVERID